MSTETEQATEALWNEVAAERTGIEPVKPAIKPAPAPAAEVPPVAVAAPAPPADFAAQLAEMEARVSDRLRKAEGHIGNLNSTQQDLKSQVEAGKAAKQETGGPTQAEIKEAAANPAEWDALKADYPEWATATEKLLESRMNTFDAKAFEATIREEMKGQTAAVRQEIIDSSLNAVFPGWKEEVKSEGFGKWFAAQPDAVKALTGSDDVGDAAKMLRMYDASKQANPANKLIEQRQATLAAATGAPKGVRTTNAAKSWEDMNASERWEHEKRTRAKSAR